MSFINEMKERARNDIKTIVLPEAEDLRVLEAADIASKEEYAKIVLIGNEEKVLSLAKNNNIELKNVTIIDPEKS